MSQRLASNRAPFRPFRLVTFGLTLAVGACGSDETGGTGASTDSTQSSHSGQGTTSSQGSTSPTASSTGTGNTTSSTGASGTNGTSSTNSTGASGSSGGSGSSGDDSNEDTSTEGSDTDDGTSSGGPVGSSSGDGSAASGSSDETSGQPGECTRELLDGLLDDYFAALSAGDPSSLPLAANVKFTENADEVEIGTTDFWMNAGDTKYSQRALDTTQCSVAAQAVIPEGTTDLPIGIRIKVEAGEMTEIETIVVRPGDYTGGFAVASNPGRIIEVADDIGWHDEVPEAQRASREELAAWVDKYFRAFPDGVCDVTSDCLRLENGGGPASGDPYFCRDGASCSQGNPGQGGTMIPRVIIVDEVRGIAAGLTNFAYFGSNGHLDMHMIKMYGGQVHAVHAMLRDTNGESGWD